MREASKEASGIEKSCQAMSGELDEILRQISDLVTSTQDLRSSEADQRRKMAAVVQKMERKEGVWDAEKAKWALAVLTSLILEPICYWSMFMLGWAVSIGLLHTITYSDILRRRWEAHLNSGHFHLGDGHVLQRND